MGTNATSTADGKHVEFDLAGTLHHNDERDPLGILRGSSGHDHRIPNTYAEAAAAAASLGPEVPVRAPTLTLGVDRAGRDTFEAIDAILRDSKDVRDRISSRQVSERIETSKALVVLTALQTAEGMCPCPDGPDAY